MLKRLRYQPISTVPQHKHLLRPFFRCPGELHSPGWSSPLSLSCLLACLLAEGFRVPKDPYSGRKEVFPRVQSSTPNPRPSAKTVTTQKTCTDHAGHPHSFFKDETALSLFLPSFRRWG